MATNEILHVGPLRECLCLQQTLPFLSEQKPHRLLSAYLFLALVLWVGESSLGSMLLGGNLLQLRCLCLCHLSHCLAMVAGLAIFSSSPFLQAFCHFLQILHYKISFQLVFSCFFRVIVPQFSCISVWSWEEVYSKSTCSAAILKLLEWKFLFPKYFYQNHSEILMM